MGRIQARKSGGHHAPAKSDAVGNFFKGVGNSIVSSANKTGDSIKTTFTSPEAMKGYKTATNIAIGVASITPVGKALAQGAIAIADKATGGKATDYLGPQNSTVNGVPGGYLAQAIMKEVDPNAQATLNRYDPKKSVMNGAKTVGKTAVTHPTSTLSVAHSVTSKSVSGAKQSLFSPAAPAHSSISQIVPAAKKQTVFGTPSMPNVRQPAHRESTLQSSHPPGGGLAHNSMGMGRNASAHKPIEPSHDEPIVKASIAPISPKSTIQLPESIAPVSSPAMSSPSDGSSFMMLPIAGGLILVLFLMMR